MKEQTLIEELVIRLADLYTDLGNAKRPGQGMKLVSTITKEIEQYAQTKVLEALERDLKDLSDCHKAHVEDNPRKEVCQVLHTLIMEKHEQIAQTKQK
jgi:hypothetical protein